MITINGRSYSLFNFPVVGICLDGTAPAYLDAAADVMPHLRRIMAQGSYGLVNSVIPSFTNPNNIAIVTGVPPIVNGICGNYFYDQERGTEVMMNDPAYLRCPTIFSALGRAGYATAAVTTKDKLRQMLGKDLVTGSICFSIESITPNIVDLVGRQPPSIYDPDISIYCIEAGVRLLEQSLAGQRASIHLAYLTTTDFVQHKYAPGTPEANRFYSQLDVLIGRLDALGVILGITADHGMNAKVHADGSPKVEFIETILHTNGYQESRVILPITDPYVIHHGALGSYATVYVDAGHVAGAAAVLKAVPGVEAVLTQAEAVARFALPADRIGQLVVLGDQGTVLGRTPQWHDLAPVAEGLRSHGGLHEQIVPLMINRPLLDDYAAWLQSGVAHNYDLFDFLCNGIPASTR